MTNSGWWLLFNMSLFITAKKKYGNSGYQNFPQQFLYINDIDTIFETSSLKFRNKYKSGTVGGPHDN